jgi:thymidylate kinase
MGRSGRSSEGEFPRADLHGERAAGGRVVAIFGPDGSGKSSVIDALMASEATPCSGFLYLHFRPRFGHGGDKGEVNTEPHCQLRRGAVASSIKLLYYLADYHVGFWATVRPALRKGQLVLFDRYYHDILVDPLRYRYGGPVALARLVGRLVPAVDVNIILTAEPRLILARKAEVEPLDLERLMEAYRDLGRSLPRCHVVDSGRPLEEVVAEVTRVLADGSTIGTADSYRQSGQKSDLGYEVAR